MIRWMKDLIDVVGKLIVAIGCVVEAMDRNTKAIYAEISTREQIGVVKTETDKTVDNKTIDEAFKLKNGLYTFKKNKDGA